MRARVVDDIDIRKHDQSLPQHLVEDRSKGVQLGLGVDHGHHDGTIVRESQGLVFINATVGAISKNSAVNSHAGNVVGAQGLDQRLLQRLAAPFVILAKSLGRLQKERRVPKDPFPQQTFTNLYLALQSLYALSQP